MKKKIAMCAWMLCVGIFLISVYKLIDIYRTYQKGDAIYEQIEDAVVASLAPSSHPQAELKSKGKKKKKKVEVTDPLISVDFATLKKTNPDIVGWLYIPDTIISYPILQADDNETYLHKTYNGQNSIFGSIFMDCSNSSDFLDRHTILYGHNMRNGSMFGSLKKYYEEAFYQTHANIYVLTETETRWYQIVSYHVADAGGKVYATSFADDTAYEAYEEYILQSSQRKTDAALGAEDSILTLSTCTGAEETRLVVHGKYMGNVK